MPTKNLTDQLKGISFFQELSADALELMAGRMVRRQIPGGSILFRKGEAARGVYILTRGKVEIFRSTADGREQVLHAETPVQSVAELPVFDGGSYPASARTAEDSEVFFLSMDDFQRLYREHPEIADAIIRNLGRRLRSLVKVVERVSLQSVPSRVASALLEQAEQSGALGGGKPFRLSGTQSDLAHELATSRESVARALGELRRQGIISTVGREITVLSAQRLTDLARGEDQTG